MTEISWDIRERAEDLYIVDGLTYERVAEETGVSISQLKRWGDDFNWREKRTEYRQALSSIRRDRALLRAGLMKKALETLDPQAVYAVSSLETVINRMKDTSEGDVGARRAVPESDATIEKRIIKTPADAIEALEEAAQLKVNKILSRPESMDLKTAKDIKDMLELIGAMRDKYAPKDTSDARKGLSKEAAEDIRKQILGLSS